MPRCPVNLYLWLPKYSQRLGFRIVVDQEGESYSQIVGGNPFLAIQKKSFISPLVPIPEKVWWQLHLAYGLLTFNMRFSPGVKKDELPFSNQLALPHFLTVWLVCWRSDFSESRTAKGMSSFFPAAFSAAAQETPSSPWCLFPAISQLGFINLGSSPQRFQRAGSFFSDDSWSFTFVVDIYPSLVKERKSLLYSEPHQSPLFHAP